MMAQNVVANGAKVEEGRSSGARSDALACGEITAAIEWAFSDASRRSPHSTQNRAAATTGAPHCGQKRKFNLNRAAIYSTTGFA